MDSVNAVNMRHSMRAGSRGRDAVRTRSCLTRVRSHSHCDIARMTLGDMQARLALELMACARRVPQRSPWRIGGESGEHTAREAGRPTYAPAHVCAGMATRTDWLSAMGEPRRAQRRARAHAHVCMGRAHGADAPSPCYVTGPPAPCACVRVRARRRACACVRTHVVCV